MSLFASRRNTRNEEAVFLLELQVFLDAREVPSDPIRKAQFWADYYRTGLAGGAPETGSRPARAPADPLGTPPASPVQDPLFPDMEDAA